MHGFTGEGVPFIGMIKLSLGVGATCLRATVMAWVLNCLRSYKAFLEQFALVDLEVVLDLYRLIWLISLMLWVLCEICLKKLKR